VTDLVHQSENPDQHSLHNNLILVEDISKTSSSEIRVKGVEGPEFKPL
jgi:hypothetical protein